MQFTVYRHRLVYEDKKLITRQFIVLKYDNGILQFTDFHRYIKSAYKVDRYESDGNARFRYVAQLLNYAFFTCGISCLDMLTVEHVQAFLTDYGMCTLPDDTEETHRTKTTVTRCVGAVIDFCVELARARSGHCMIQEDMLYTMRSKRDKRGKTIDVRVPVFTVKYRDCETLHIFRDIPDRAFRMLMDHIITFHKDLLGLVIVQAFAGLRPSEACNVRRIDSALGPGFLFEIVDGELIQVRIDLREELNLRSDTVSVGKIKKERIQVVPDIFLRAFQQLYNVYADYCKGKPYETDYGPFSVNSLGKAMTYDSYLKKFKAVIKEMIPIYLSSENPEMVVYGRALMENSISPHVFRHFYTVQLVLSGVEDLNTLMFYRGDTSPESARTYLQNKGDLQKRHKKVTDEMYEYLMWRSGKENKENAE